MSRRVYALAVLVVVAAVVAIPVLSASGDVVQTISFKELNKGSTFHYIDNPPMNKKNAKPVLSPGDTFVFTNPIGDGKSGELRATCTTEHKAPANDTGFGKAHALCSGAFVLSDGTLFASVTDAGGKVTHGAITGGTGAYANARGTLTSTQSKSGSDDVVTLVS